jgi:molybdenum cofactor cytidylyltransferase
VVLAAGRSSRMGSPKQLLVLEGKTLLRRTVDTVLASSVDLVVVVSIYNRELEGLPVVIAPFVHEPNALSDSIKNGLCAIRNWETTTSTTIDGALFIPCDLPMLSSRHLDALVGHYNGEIQIAASSYSGVVGAPMLFDRALWPELDHLSGDAGGRQIIGKHKEKTASVEFEAGAFDLDTPEDVDAFRRRQQTI